MYFWEDVCIPILGIAGIIASVIFTIALFANLAAGRECDNYKELTGAKTYFTWTTGCLVQGSDQKWLTLKAITSNDITVHAK